MEIIELPATRRERLGTGETRRLRRDGRLPVVFYGPKREAESFTVDAKEFYTRVAHLEGTHLIRLAENGNAERVGIVQETQFHPVSGMPLHADLYEVDMQKPITVRVPLHTVGKPVGVGLGGLLQTFRRDLEVACLPMNIPDSISLDVSHLGVQESIKVSQVSLPEGVSAVFDYDFTVSTVLAPVAEEPRGKAAETAKGAKGGKGKK